MKFNEFYILEYPETLDPEIYNGDIFEKENKKYLSVVKSNSPQKIKLNVNFNGENLSLDYNLHLKFVSKEIGTILGLEYNNKLVLWHVFKQPFKENSIVTSQIWQDKNHKGLYRSLIFNYYLNNNYDYIQSDNKLTPMGFNTWKKMIQYALDNGHRVCVVTNEGEFELKQSDDLNKFNKQSEIFRLYSKR